MKTLRPDLALISQWIHPDSRVLDLGCGDGALLDWLRKSRHVSGYGLEIAPRKITSCLKKRVNVLQINLDHGLQCFADHAFDYVIMTQTLQAIRQPENLLTDMLRVGREVIVTFPNTAHWRCRWQMALHGRMPVTRHLPHPWYKSSNIRHFSLHDFEHLCALKEIRILQREVVDYAHRPNPMAQKMPNLFGEIALYRLQGPG